MNATGGPSGEPDYESMNDWKRTKTFIGNMLTEAREAGMDDGQTIHMTKRLIDNLLSVFPPSNEEENSLRSIWFYEDDKGKEAIIKILFSICDPQNPLSKIEWEELARLMAKSVTRVLGFLDDLRP